MHLTTLFLAGITAVSIAVLPVAYARTLRLALSDDATTLDPHVANLAINNRLLNNIYEALVRRDKDFQIVPSLAVSWTQPDAKTWRFKLREGVKFHDGSAFTAEDVVFSAARVLHPLSSFKDALQGVASAKRVDDLTVEFSMTEPNPVMLQHLLSFNIMSKAWCIKRNAQNPQNYTDKEDSVASRLSNGTGPFMLKSRAPDVKTVLVAHPQWWNRAAADRGNVSAVEWTPIKQNSTRMAALMSGSVDIVIDPPLQDRARFKNMPDMKLQVGSEARVLYFALDQSRDTLLYGDTYGQNAGKNPFRDLRVRQAIAHAMDGDLIIDKVNRGYGRPTGLSIGKEVQGYAPALDKRLPVDIPRAKALMADAGYAKGFEVTLDCLNQSPFGEHCQALASQLAPIGIKLNINMVAFSNIFPKLRKFDTSFYVMGFGSSTMDAYQLLNALVQSAGANTGESNWGRYSNAKLDALINRIKGELDVTTRNTLIAQALTIARDDLAIIPYLQVVQAWAMRKNIDAPYIADNKPYWYRFSVN